MSTLSGDAAKDQVHLHAPCWNEARMIPYFFRHYTGLADRFFIYDSGSTDGSLEQLAGDERVRVVAWEPAGDSIFRAERDLANECWKPSRGAADWVFLVELSEHLHHPDLRDVLRQARRDGATAIKAAGYEMLADRFPTGDQPLSRLVTSGVRLPQRDRLAVFDPDAVAETNFGVGRQSAEPIGHVVWDIRHPIALLHYERLGVDYICERNERQAARLRPDDIACEYGLHCRMSRNSIAVQQLALTRMALPVPMLGEAVSFAPTLDEQKLLLGQSGLFHDAWYLAQYPDVAAAGLDPLDHFCRNGWREGRRPNPLFDPTWYAAAYGELIGDVNPLLDYVTAGEALGRKPAPDFDPMEYRFRHALATADSPLRHRLLGAATASR